MIYLNNLTLLIKFAFNVLFILFTSEARHYQTSRCLIPQNHERKKMTLHMSLQMKIKLLPFELSII